MRNWLADRRDKDNSARIESESLAPRELEIFVNVMSLAEECLRIVLSKSLIVDPAAQAKVIVTNHAFNLLCSAVEDVLVGRYSAASDHWRSIIESPRFLLALQLKPGLSQKMMRGQLKIDVALETIRNEFTEQYPGADLSWVNEMAGEVGRMQPFSHVHLRTASAGFPIQDVPGSRIYSVVPGGAVVPARVLDSVMILADAAIILAAAMFFAFSTSDPDVEALSSGGGFKALQESRTKLLTIAKERGIEI